MYQTELIKSYANNHARVMRFTTPHGVVTTPTFMPVGTRAAVNHMTADQLRDSGSQIILGGNTYHMLCAPGLEKIQNSGGMHRMMDWHGPMLTDSGGFQVFSLSKQGKYCTMREDGAVFKHPTHGQRIHLTPHHAIHAQRIIGADIIMAFDVCTPERGGRAMAYDCMQRTHRWLLSSQEAHQKAPNSVYGKQQALFGIIQGGRFRDLREESAQFVCKQPLDGIAIGGESIGFDRQKTRDILNWIHPILPQDKLHYTMGVGLYPQDLIDVVALGVDLFDCVAPTRNARHGCLYHGRIMPHQDWLTFDHQGEEKGRLLIKKAIYANDQRPILEGCSCITCQRHTRAYLHYLFKIKSSLYSNLACIHNVQVMHAVCEAMRAHILTSEHT